MKTVDLYSHFSNEVKAFIRSKVKDPDLTHDLLQDVFVKAHLKIDQLEHADKTKQWLFSIARNLVMDHFRKNIMIYKHSQIINSPEENPQEENVMESCVAPMINKLPSVYKEALLEVEINGTDQKTLAEKLNISYSGAKSRVQRAREMLKSRLLDCCKITADKYGNIVSHVPKHACSGC